MFGMQGANAVDLGLSRNEIEKRFVDIGYWATDEHRARYRCTLSPSAYLLSQGEQDAMQLLARTTYAAVTDLNGSLCDIAAKKSPANHDEGRLLRLANCGSRALLRPSDGMRSIPPLMKLDLMLSEDGTFKIAEIDAYNARGLGFMALLEECLQGVPDIRRFPGLSGVLSALSQAGAEREWTIVVSDYERFYDTPFRVFASAAGRRGTNVRVSCAPSSAEAARMERVIIIPDTLDTSDGTAVRSALLARYREGSLATLYPPVAYLGSKAMLPYVRAYPGMREFIPRTRLVGRKTMNLPHGVPSSPTVLKAAISSGLKQVYFSDLDVESFSAAYESASALRTPSWILQEQVRQKSVPIVVFDEDGSRVERPYYLRITAYIGKDGVIDAEVTGRPDPKVHGAPDCIQLPVILA